MDFVFIYSTALLFFMLMDPFGNLPVFIATLRKIPEDRYVPVILRECVFALIAMFLALAVGRAFLGILHISHSALGLAGGLILLLMGIKMVFSSFSEEKVPAATEPFVVPIAIPFICDPGLVAILITIRNSNPSASFGNCLAALALAWVAQTLILLCGRRIAAILGHKTLDALESLLGLLLICIAVGMILAGIHEVYGVGNVKPY